jgi:prepilin-type N-terminal cleavage/methylation domain-containing protein
MRQQSSETRGFTLIELLIVVAIIAILAAIAVPNFLEAQTRSKVARVKADIRSLVTSVESYRVDNNRYPLDELGNTPTPIPAGLTQYDYRTLRFWMRVTTPISYISSILTDTFRDKRETTEATNFPSSKNYFWPHNQDLFNSGWYGTGQADDVAYINKVHKSGSDGIGFYSVGPDNSHFTPYDSAGNITADSMEFLAYDPSNGTVSDGNILWNNKTYRMGW